MVPVAICWSETVLRHSTCVCVCRLEEQMTSDIQAILQLLQRQSILGPPAYSTVAVIPDYHKPVQPVTAMQTQVIERHSICPLCNISFD